MDITITMLGGISHTLRVHPEATVSSLKQLIQNELGVPVQKQKLVFMNGQRTHLSDDSEPVCSYGLQPGSQVSLLVTQPPDLHPTFEVFLKDLQGKTTTYDIRPDETVMNFKRRVESREGVPANQQRLIYQSRELQDEKSLSDYNVEALGTINMTSRLRGG
ncbi:polyubiquitin-like [Pagrus major]|uniref:polyubiquitin-like n=1 Tax=Pagrus major TaxID=143350 RepID=UPI003CC8D002